MVVNNISREIKQKILTYIWLFDNIWLCNKYIVTWSELESSSHINHYLCALFFLGDFMKFDKNILNILYKDAKKAFSRGEIPVSAIIFDKNGKIISHSCNNRQKKHNILGHAEINAIIKAEKKIKDWRLNGYKMLVTLHPCDLCKLVIEHSRVDEVYYLLEKNKQIDQNNKYIKISEKNIQNYDLIILKFQDLLTNFFTNLR